jgi:hypothetical protein
MASKKNTVTYTTAAGDTVKSATVVYTHALYVFNPSQPWKDPSRWHWHQSLKNAKDKLTTYQNKGLRGMIVPVTTDGSKDSVWLDRINDLKTPADVDNIPAMRIAAAEKQVEHYTAELVRYDDDIRKKKSTKFVSLDQLRGMREGVKGSLDKAVAELEATRLEHTPKPVTEKKVRRPSRRNAFLKEITEAAEKATKGGRSLSFTPTGYAVTSERKADGSFKSLSIGLGDGNFVEMHIPFKAEHVKKVAMRLWGLIQVSGL